MIEDRSDGIPTPHSVFYLFLLAVHARGRMAARSESARRSRRRATRRPRRRMRAFRPSRRRRSWCRPRSRPRRRKPRAPSMPEGADGPGGNRRLPRGDQSGRGRPAEARVHAASRTSRTGRRISSCSSSARSTFMSRNPDCSGRDLPTHRTTYAAGAPQYKMEQGAGVLEVRLQAPVANRRQGDEDLPISTRGSYVIDVAFEIANEGSTALKPYAYFQFLRDGKPPAGDSAMLPTFTGVGVYTDKDKFQKIAFSDIEKNKAVLPKDEQRRLDRYGPALLPRRLAAQERHAARVLYAPGGQSLCSGCDRARAEASSRAPRPPSACRSMPARRSRKSLPHSRPGST